MTRLYPLLVLSVCLLLNGCAQIQQKMTFLEQFGYEVDSIAPLYVINKPMVEFQENWSVDTGDGYDEKSRIRPIVLEAVVYAVNKDGDLIAYDKTTGDELWEKELEFNVSAGLSHLLGTLYLTTDSGKVVALSAETGDILWERQLSSEVLSPVAVGRATVIAQTNDGKLVALNATTGEELWTYKREIPILSLRGLSSPIISDDIVIAGFANGKLAALAVDTGQWLWERRITIPKGSSEISRIVDIDADPVIYDDIIYVSAYQGNLVALNKRDGNVIWRREVSSTKGLDVTEKFIAITDSDDLVRGIDRMTGATLWTQKYLKGRGLTSPLVANAYVIVADKGGYVHALSRATGTELGRIQVSSDQISARLAQEQGMFYVYANDGTLAQLQVSLVQ